jgi:oligopeptide/dipeptide ABC transporter ATP-binding protein
MASLLDIDSLSVDISTESGLARAVDTVSFDVRGGETFCLVGESGCGKTLTALAVMRLLPDSARASGRALFDGVDIMALSEREMCRLRGGSMGMVFQEPSASLNPVFTIGDQIAEAASTHGLARGRAARDAAVRLLAEVGMPDPERRAREYPHQLSGGMQQRTLIAMALAGQPRLLIADEPTTALDATVQAQILDLLRRVQRDRGMALLLITHDLGLVAEAADRVAVMYAGRIVEQGAAQAVLAAPAHPYTRMLLACRPDKTSGKRLAAIPGSVPSPGEKFSGCTFAPRCPISENKCREASPPLDEIAEGRRAACYKPMSDKK